MKKRIGLSCAAVGLMAGALMAPTFAAPQASEAKISILNPAGTPPPVRLVPMAPRLDTIDGKTIYVVGISFTEPVIPVLHKLLQERFPKTTWVLKMKAGSYFDDAPDLWKEIKEEGDGAILGIGH